MHLIIMKNLLLTRKTGRYWLADGRCSLQRRVASRRARHALKMAAGVERVSAAFKPEPASASEVATLLSGVPGRYVIADVPPVGVLTIQSQSTPSSPSANNNITPVKVANTLVVYPVHDRTAKQ